MIQKDDYKVYILAAGEVVEIHCNLHLKSTARVRKGSDTNQAANELVQDAHHHIYGDIRDEIVRIRRQVQNESMGFSVNQSEDMFRDLIARLDCRQ